MSEKKQAGSGEFGWSMTLKKETSWNMNLNGMMDGRRSEWG